MSTRKAFARRAALGLILALNACGTDTMQPPEAQTPSVAGSWQQSTALPWAVDIEVGQDGGSLSGCGVAVASGGLRIVTTLAGTVRADSAVSFTAGWDVGGGSTRSWQFDGRVVANLLSGTVVYGSPQPGDALDTLWLDVPVSLDRSSLVSGVCSS